MIRHPTVVRLVLSFGALAASLVLLPSCGGGSGDVPGRIAYVGQDGDIYLVNSDGGGLLQLTEDGSLDPQALAVTSYAWPTWSPDGERLAVSKVTRENAPDGEIESAIQILDASSGDVTVVYENPPVAFPFIANRIPHYMYWSPDSTRLAFLANTGDDDGLTLFAASLNGGQGGNPVPIVIGAPIYMAWDPASSLMLLHVGETMYLVDVSEPLVLDRFSRRPTGFRAASWSADGSRMAYSGIYAGRLSLLVADSEGAHNMPLADVGSRQAFLWSPTDETLAFADSANPAVPYFDKVTTVDLASGDMRTLVDEPVLAFFWSPSGLKLAYVAVDPMRGDLTWKVIDRDGGQARELVTFVPSREYLTTLTFFDQYAPSNSIWSPDGTHLLFAGLVEDSEGAAYLASNDESLIYVANVDGSSVKPIAEGSIAFWSSN